MTILQKPYKLLCFIIIVLIALVGTVVIIQHNNNLQRKVTLEKLEAEIYKIEIVDIGYNEHFPIKINIYFETDENGIIKAESIVTECKRNRYYEYASIIPYINNEPSNIVYLSLEIHNVNKYDKWGNFVIRDNFEYELSAKFDMNALKRIS